MPFDSEVPEKSRDLIVLEKARERIARYGWTSGELCNEAGQFCLIGALAGAPRQASTSTDDQIYYDNAEPFVGLLGFDSVEAAYTWNDAPARRQDEVLSRFDSAILHLSEG